MKAAVIGLGYVGAVTSACLADLGHDVVGMDVDSLKVEEIQAGRSPIVEPRLADLIAAGRDSGRLRASGELASAVADCDVALVCVGTPARSDGPVDLQHVERVTAEIGRELASRDSFLAIVYRSTMPPGTVEGNLLHVLERESSRQADRDFGVAMAPEFLREGSGVDDFFDPPFTVAGVREDRTLALVSELFAPLERPLHALAVNQAESLKYACNAFHAVKVTFANEIGRILSALDVDAREVMRIFCLDDRLNISPAYLRPGFAFGGSCLPKDLRALTHVARMHDVEAPMLAGVVPSNDHHVRLGLRRILDTGARDVALLGLSFKSQTDDLRDSPYVDLAETLLGKGVRLRIFDPIVNPERLIGANRRYVDTHLPHLGEILVSTPEEALQGATVAVLGTADPSAIRAVSELRPDHVLDLHGGLGDDIEALPGYQGIAW